MPPLRTVARNLAFSVYVLLRGRFKDRAIQASERLVGRHALQGTIPGLDGGRYGFQVPGLLGPYVIARSRLRIAGWSLDLKAGRPLAWRVRLGGRIIDAHREDRPDLLAAFAELADLPPECGGYLDLPVRLGPSLLSIETETEPDSWQPLFRAVVVGFGRLQGDWDPDAAFRYRAWSARERTAEIALAALAKDTAAPPATVSAIVVGIDDEAARDTIRSLEAQTLAPCETVRAAAAGTPGLAEALATARGEFVLPLEAGDMLRPYGLAKLLGIAAAMPSADLIYADEENGPAGAETPYVKPAWSPDTLEAFDYIGAPALYRTEIARSLGARGLYDLALRFTERTDRIHHLGTVLCRRPRLPTEAAPGHDDAAALMGRLARTGRDGTVISLAPGGSALVVRTPPPDRAPLVSVVMPTAGRDIEIAGRKIDLVLDCITSIRERSTYQTLEFIIVANPDLPEAKHAALKALGCTIVMYEDPVFNVAKKLNLGARQATGDYLLLMNDDIEIVAPDWIERLLAQAAKPHVGVVGGKLLYVDGTIQHAGVVLARGNPDHVRRFYPAADRGYAWSTAAPRNYLAVTGACMMSRAEVYRAVGGYSEALGISFNDVDYCLKVRGLGLHVVYEPGCELIHFESVSRVPSLDRAEFDYFTTHWGGATATDPFYDNDAFGTAPASFEPYFRSAGGPVPGEPVPGRPTTVIPGLAAGENPEPTAREAAEVGDRGTRTALLYLVRGADPGFEESYRTFLASYDAHPAGEPHDLILVCKGFAQDAGVTAVAEAFGRRVARVLEVADDGFDLGAYRDAARLVEHERVCCLNTNSRILSDDWLAKLSHHLHRDEVGLVGATGSFEGLGHDRRFDPFPNVHLRSNAFLTGRMDFLTFVGDGPIREKIDAYLRESGPDSLTRRVLASGRSVLVVGADGRGYPPRLWPRSGTFRLGGQWNLLVGDNQTRAFARYAWPERSSVTRRTWGQFIADLPPPSLGRPL